MKNSNETNLNETNLNYDPVKLKPVTHEPTQTHRWVVKPLNGIKFREWSLKSITNILTKNNGKTYNDITISFIDYID